MLFDCEDLIRRRAAWNLGSFIGKKIGYILRRLAGGHIRISDKHHRLRGHGNFLYFTRRHCNRHGDAGRLDNDIFRDSRGECVDSIGNRDIIHRKSVLRPLAVCPEDEVRNIRLKNKQSEDKERENLSRADSQPCSEKRVH